MEHDIPFGNSNRENGTTFLDFPLFLGIFQWDEPTKRVPFTAEPEIPEILTKWKAPFVSFFTVPSPLEPFGSRSIDVYRGVASFTQIRTCVLEKLVGLLKRFSVKVKAICCSIVTCPCNVKICSCLSRCYSASFSHEKFNSLSGGM